MKTVLATILAGTFSLGLVAAAQAQQAQIPTPVNPFPINPVATDGTPLPTQSQAYATRGDLFSGRSVATAPLGFVGDVAGAGLGAAGTVVDTGIGAAGDVVGGGLGVAGVR